MKSLQYTINERLKLSNRNIKLSYVSTIKDLKEKYNLIAQHEYPKRCNYTYDVTPEIEKVFVDLIDDKGISCEELTKFIQDETNITDLKVDKGFNQRYGSYHVTLDIESISTEVGGIEIYPLSNPLSKSDSCIEFYYAAKYSNEKLPILEILCKLFDYIMSKNE